MRHRRETQRAWCRVAASLVGSFGLSLAAQAGTAVHLTLKDHRFAPALVTVPAGQPVTIEIRNLDPTPAEIESKTLRFEKVVAGNSRIIVQVRALSPGRYRFFDDYHEDTTEGFLVAQ